MFINNIQVVNHKNIIEQPSLLRTSIVKRISDSKFRLPLCKRTIDDIETTSITQ